MAQSTTARATIFILREIIGEALYFPVWWYTLGMVGTARSLTRKWFDVLNQLSLPILFKTLSRPMYGDYTRSGRIISFFFRILLIVTRSIVFLGWTAIELVLMLLWLAGPVIAVAMLVRQIIPL
jgi:hypothetical protein